MNIFCLLASVSETEFKLHINPITYLLTNTGLEITRPHKDTCGTSFVAFLLPELYKEIVG